MNLRLLTTSTFLLVFLTALAAPTKALAAIQSLNGLTGQNQTFQNDTNVIISSANRVHTLGWQGYLPISRGGTGVGSFTVGSLLFFNGSTFAENNSKLFWDNTNYRLGIGTSSPTTTLDVSGNAKVTSLTSTADSTINTLNIGLGGGSISSNTALGINTLPNNTIGSRNVAVGSGALYANTVQSDSTAIGYGALANSANSGEQNTAVGSQALISNTSGSYNAAFGNGALLSNTSGIRNVAVGGEALRLNNTGSNNVAIGFRSMAYNTPGGANVAVGDLSGANLTGGANVVIGQAAAINQADNTPLTTANYSIYIGNSVRGYDNNDFNSIVIGTSAAGAGANKTVIGNQLMTDVYFGSALGLANTHATKMFLGSSTTPGCIVMGDTNGGLAYVTVSNGTLTVSTTPPSACQ